MSWPYPRLLPTSYRTLVITQQSNDQLLLCELRITSSNYRSLHPIIVLGSPGEVQSISVADFGPFYVITTLPKRQTYVKDASGGVFTPYLRPVAGVCCNFNGQAILGNLDVGSGPPWSILGARGIAWSAIGNFEFAPEVDQTAGFRQLFFPATDSPHNSLVSSEPQGGGEIQAIRKLGNNVLVYANGGKILLSPSVVANTFVYGERIMPGLGIRSGNHVAGDEYTHGYIDTLNDFWIAEAPAKLTKLGYREYISAMSLNNTLVSFLAKDKRFYISDGTQCLVVNQFGAYHCNQCPSGIMGLPQGGILATYIELPDSEARITTDKLDYESRGLKSVESITADVALHATAKAFIAVDWRSRTNAPFRRSKWVYAGPTAEAAVHVTALEFRLKLRLTSYVEAEVDSLLANVKFSDQRFKRGTVPAQYNAAEGSSEEVVSDVT